MKTEGMQTVEVEIPIFTGFDYIGYQMPKKGDRVLCYINGSYVLYGTDKDWEYERTFVYRKLRTDDGKKP
jgi:hypothetical protein